MEWEALNTTFDPIAADMWACGVILFNMVGLEVADCTCPMRALSSLSLRKPATPHLSNVPGPNVRRQHRVKWILTLSLSPTKKSEAIGFDFDARHTTPTSAFNGYLFVDASEMLVDECDEGPPPRDSRGIRLNAPLWEDPTRT